MGRKSQWFRDIHGTDDRKLLDELRNQALDHVETMRRARIDRLDPGGGPIKKAAVLVGAKQRATAVETSIPGQTTGVFVTGAIQIRSGEDELAATLKQKLRRGAQAYLAPSTARLFRYDEERETWVLVDASGWNAKDKYVWGRVDRPGIYAAVALPRGKKELQRVAFQSLAHRTIRDAVASGHFAKAADFGNPEAFRDYLVDFGRLDQDSARDKRDLDLALKAHRQMTRTLGPLELERLGGNPQWDVLEDILVKLPDVRLDIGIDAAIPFWPIFERVANRVGPWFPMGPTNINGRVKSLAMHPTKSDVLYAGSANGGVWKSTNGGDFWIAKWKFENSLAVGAIATAPSNGKIVYAATGEDTPGWSPSYGGVGVFRSADGGDSWTQVATAAEVGGRCSKVVVHPADSGKVYVASDTGVHRSMVGLVATVGGSPVMTWTNVLPGPATDVVMQHDHPEVMFAGIHNNGVFKTTDGGTNWKRIEGNRVSVFAIILPLRENFPVDGDAGWIKLALGRSGEGGSNFIVAKLGKDSATTLISSDGGNEWIKSSGSVGVDYDEWCSMVAVHPRQPRHIYLASAVMQHSTDGWNFKDSPGTYYDHHQMVFHHTDDDIAYVCCDGGVYRTTDNGESWHLRSGYLTATQLMSLGVASSGEFIAGSATQDQGIIQTNGSSIWANHNGGNEWGMFVVDPNDSRNIFISPGGGQIRRSTDRGVSYTSPTKGLTDWWAQMNRSTVPASFAHAAVKPGDSGIVVGAATVSDKGQDANGNEVQYPEGHRIYYSSNGGVDWSIVFTLPHRGSRVAFAPSDGSRVYAATSLGRVFRSSASGGSGWAEAGTAANRPPAAFITSIAVDPFNKDRLYITYGGTGMRHIYRSNDAGATWAACDGTAAAMALPDIALLDVVVDSENPDVLYVASDIGVFRSNDRGSTWYWANDSFGENDLPKVTVTGLEIHPGTHRLYASTMGRGLYSTQATGIPSLRATHVRLAREIPQPSGIVKLKLTDGSDTYVMTRLEVIRRIQAGTDVYTIGPDGHRTQVRALEPDARHPLAYLSSAPDASMANNLLSLPRFYG